MIIMMRLPGHEQGPKSRASATSQRVGQLETLEIRIYQHRPRPHHHHHHHLKCITSLRLLPDDVNDTVDQLNSVRVVALCPIVPSTSLEHSVNVNLHRCIFFPPKMVFFQKLAKGAGGFNPFSTPWPMVAWHAGVDILPKCAKGCFIFFEVDYTWPNTRLSGLNIWPLGPDLIS